MQKPKICSNLLLLMTRAIFGVETKSRSRVLYRIFSLGGDVVCGLTKMDKITKYFSRKRPRLKKKLILMKFWTFLKKKIGALDCNWCIILFQKFV